MATQRYFFGKGRVSLATKDATTGLYKVFTWLGNVATLTVSLEVEKLTHNESYTGQNLEDVSIITAKKSNFVARVENFDIDALAFGLYSNKVTVAGAVITGEVLPSGLLAGDEVATKHPKISAVAVKDSAVGPATLSLTTDYTIEDAVMGRLKIVNLGAYTQPFKVDYTYGARKDLGMFLNAAPERWLRYEGINLANASSKVVVDLYKVQVDPMSELPLISDGNAVGGYDMKGGVLMESLIASTDALGQFGCFRDLA
jgi:hypothetical protein